MMSTLYELVAVFATALALSAAILGWTSVKQSGRKIVCTWDGHGRFDRIKMLYLGVSALAVFAVMVENLNTLYRLLGANREETIAVAYGLILGTVVLTALLQAAIIRLSAKWHRLKIVERLYYDLVKAERKRSKSKTRTLQPQQVRRSPAHHPHPGQRRHHGAYDCVTDTVVFPDFGEKVVPFPQGERQEQEPASAEDMKTSVEAIGTLVADALRNLDAQQFEFVLLARSADGATRTVAELGNLSALIDPDQEYEEGPGWSYQDCPETLGKSVSNCDVVDQD